jgi:hypothetical protein
MKKKKEWLATTRTSTTARIVTIACAENIFFRCSVNAILRAGPRNLPKRLHSALDKILLDKKMTLDFLSLLYTHYTEEGEAGDVATLLINEAMEVELNTIQGNLAYDLLHY